MGSILTHPAPNRFEGVLTNLRELFSHKSDLVHNINILDEHTWSRRHEKLLAQRPLLSYITVPHRQQSRGFDNGTWLRIGGQGSQLPRCAHRMVFLKHVGQIKWEASNVHEKLLCRMKESSEICARSTLVPAAVAPWILEACRNRSQGRRCRNIMPVEDQGGQRVAHRVMGCGPNSTRRSQWSTAWHARARTPHREGLTF